MHLHSNEQGGERQRRNAIFSLVLNSLDNLISKFGNVVLLRRNLKKVFMSNKPLSINLIALFSRN